MNWYTYSGFADEIDKDIGVQMDVMESLGIKFIEPRGVNGINVSKLTVEEAREVKSQFDMRGFRVSSIGSPVGKIKLSDSFDDDIGVLSHVLEIAEIFETKYVRMFSPFIPEGEKPEKYRDEVLRRMQGYVDAARGRDVVLLHENEGSNIYGQTALRCLDIFESVGSDRLKAVFDPGNFAYADYDALEAYEILDDYIEYVHIKDSTGNKVVVPAGKGNVQYKEIFRRLKEKGRNYFLSLEPHLSSFTGFAEIDGSIKLQEGGSKERFAFAFKCLKEIVDSI